VLCTTAPAAAHTGWHTILRDGDLLLQTQEGPVGELRVRAEQIFAGSCDHPTAALVRAIGDGAGLGFAAWRELLDVQDEAGERVVLVQEDPGFPWRLRERVIAVRVTHGPDGPPDVHDRHGPVDPVEEAAVVLVLEGRGVKEPPPPTPGVVRRARAHLRIELRQLQDGRCAVVHVDQGDLGGSFPAFLRERWWRHEGKRRLAALLAHFNASRPSPD
jgi:hypothetical protein